MIARAFWKLSQFSKRVNSKSADTFFVQRRGSNQKPHVPHVYQQNVFRRGWNEAKNHIPNQNFFSLVCMRIKKIPSFL